MRRPAAFAALVLLGGVAGCIGGVGTDATVTEFEPRVTVSDVGVPSTGDDGVRRCTWVGPPPGHYGVTGHVVVERPVGSQASRAARFRVEVGIGDGPWRTARNVSLTPGEYERVTLVQVATNDGVIAVGDAATVGVRVRRGGRTVAETTRTVQAIESGGCTDESVERIG